MTEGILNLPWQIQVSIASGYISYLIAFYGKRTHHKTIDITFTTFLFGLIATFVIFYFSYLGVIKSGVLAFVATVVFGFIWRYVGQATVGSLFRTTNASWANDDPSALATLISNNSIPITQIGVELDDGTWLTCEDTSLYNKAPFGPCLLGPTGDLAIYLTHQERDGIKTELSSTQDDDYGDRITYLPAFRIRRVTIRHKK